MAGMSDARLLDGGRRLQAIAQSGLAYRQTAYNRDRYEEVGEISLALVAASAGCSIEDVTAVFAPEVGHATPKLDVRGAVFRGEEILLVLEASSGRWTLPGGWAEIGQSAGESAVREIREESLKLVALHDREQRGYRPHPWYTHKATFLCELTSARPDGEPDDEITEVGFFPERSLPPLDPARASSDLVATCFAHHRDRSLPTEFD